MDLFRSLQRLELVTDLLSLSVGIDGYVGKLDISCVSSQRTRIVVVSSAGHGVELREL